MADIDRPNRNVLDRALAIYRDSMREFLIRNLKRVPGQTLEKGVESALRGNRRLQLEDRLKQRKDVEDFIDIGDFQPLIAHHWD